MPLLDEAWSHLGDPEEVLRAAAAGGRRAPTASMPSRWSPRAGFAARSTPRPSPSGSPGGGGRAVAERAEGDPDWEYGHVIVDEAQELSPMAWRMLMRRCPTRSMTVVGDVAQTSAPWGVRSWGAALEPVAPDRWRVAELTVNYRTPSEVMAVAADVLAAVDPAAESPSSVRESGQLPLAHRVGDGEDLARPGHLGGESGARGDRRGQTGGHRAGAFYAAIVAAVASASRTRSAPARRGSTPRSPYSR